MTESWLVLKFGGTSVSGSLQWQTIASLAERRLEGGYRVLLVCSALSGVTNTLQAFADTAGQAHTEAIVALLERHRQLGAELGVKVDDLLDVAGRDIDRSLAQIAAAADRASRLRAVADLLPLGEWLSTRIGERYLARTLQVEWVDARQALKAVAEKDVDGRRARLSARCQSGRDRELTESWSRKAPLLITQGFVAAHPVEGNALLGRGGSDTSAALFAGRLGAEHVEIWTDVPGLFSADPRVIPEARLLHMLNYDEALEMAASGAKVVHSRCIRAAADSHIPIMVRDLGQPDFSGTTIGDATGDNGEEGIRSVCRQPDMAVLLLQNLDTREHVGFLAWVFELISEAGVSVDLVATSETTTTVAINRTTNQLDDASLAQLADDLRARCAVTVHSDCSGINLVGRGARVALAKLDPDGGFFASHPLLMLSQSANDLCISLLLRSSDADDLLRHLHRALISDKLERGLVSGVFGQGWRELKG